MSAEVCAALANFGSAGVGTWNRSHSSALHASVVDVKQQGAAGIGRIGGEDGRHGQTVDQVGVDRADQGSPALQFVVELRVVVDQPRSLEAGK